MARKQRTKTPDPRKNNHRPTKEVEQLKDYYLEHIRPHNDNEQRGACRQIERVLAAGITVDECYTAMNNYRNAPYRTPHYSKNIRSFFTVEIIKMWQVPPPPRATQTKVVDPSIAALDRLKAVAPVPIPLPPEPEPEEEEERHL